MPETIKTNLIQLRGSRVVGEVVGFREVKLLDTLKKGKLLF